MTAVDSLACLAEAIRSTPIRRPVCASTTHGICPGPFIS